MTSSPRGTNSVVIPRDDAAAVASGWHVAAYLAGRNDLEAELSAQARALEVASAGLDTLLLSVLLARRGRSWQRFAGAPRAPWDGDSGDPGALVAFAGGAAAVDPRRRLALVIGSHGNGWSVEDGPISLGADITSGSSLTTPALGSALAELRRQRGRRLELLVLDACLMASVETVVQIADHVDVVVAAASRTPRVGADHVAVVHGLARDLARVGTDRVDPDARELGRRWVRGWWPARARRSPAGAAMGAPTVSAIDARATRPLVRTLDRFGSSLAAGMADGDGPTIVAAVLDAWRSVPGATDLGSFAAHIDASASALVSPAAPGMVAAAAEVLTLLEPGRSTVIATTASAAAGATGLTVALSRRGRPDGYRARKLRAARISGWCSFLDSLGRFPAGTAS